MEKVPLKNQIISWLKNQQYWFQYSANELLEGNEINDDLLERTYSFFKQDNELILSKVYPEIHYKEIEIDKEYAVESLTLNLISGVENVNALTKNQSIEINPNLTIIYGNNGSGKSGYTRLLNNAFNSRGDKNILGNVFSEQENAQPKCVFTFTSSEGIYEKKFPEDILSGEFSSYSCFDSHSIKIHLDNDNQLNFTPIGFEFFDKILLLLEALREKLTLEISQNRPKNDYQIHFTNPNTIKELIDNLGANTDGNLLDDLSTFSERDEEQSKKHSHRIVELQKLNIQVQITGLEKMQRELTQFLDRQQQILDYLTDEIVTYGLQLIDDYSQLLKLSKEQGVRSLQSYDINAIGSSAWREFILSAKKYSKEIENTRENSEYPNENDNCLFCLQPLLTHQNELIETYWNFLKSEAERELNRTIQKIRELTKELKGLSPVKFDESTMLYSYLITIDPILVGKWKNIVSDTEMNRQNLIQNLDNLNEELPAKSFKVHTDEFHDIPIKIKKEIESLSTKKPDAEISVLTVENLFLKDKHLLKQLLPKIKEYISKHKWADKAEKTLNQFKTNSVTSLQGALFSQHINEKYTEIFNDECVKLSAPQVVNISQQNSKAKSFRRLQVAKKSASQILSEGEQRAISLADFLTEVQLNPNSKGVIFDDPVTSLDHKRRGLIAERLTSLSKEKQVVIFSHDLLFVNFLKNFAEENSVEFQCHWIEKVSDQVGVIHNNNSPATEGDYKNAKLALDALDLAKKCAPQLREAVLKDGFASLRTCYEYLVIFDLFKQVVLRFDERISIERLKEVVVLPEFSNKIIEKVGLLSRYIEAHLHSDTFLGTKPTTEDLKKEIDEFQSLKKELGELRKKVLA